MNYTIFKQIIYIICISVCSKIAILDMNETHKPGP
nr:MAG TPA: hypothetical protein [Caudoviricetes sp.]